MSNSHLPEHPSLEYLRKLAKDRLRELRAKNPKAKLSDGPTRHCAGSRIPSWRALKAEVDRRQAGNTAAFFDACARRRRRGCSRACSREIRSLFVPRTRRPHAGWTGLHSAAQQGHLDIVRLLLDRGADPNAREAGDHTYPLHWAAARRHMDIVRTLLDAGSDVHGVGDDHELDVIGWGTFFHAEDQPRGQTRKLLRCWSNAERGITSSRQCRLEIST